MRHVGQKPICSKAVIQTLIVLVVFIIEARRWNRYVGGSLQTGDGMFKRVLVAWIA